MDRRTWVQLMAVLAAARPALPQQGGRGQAPMRVTKDQVVGALKLMGLEFNDAELDMMLPSVNRALGNYEALRQVEIGYSVEPSFHFSPGLPDRKPIKGPQRFTTTIAAAGAAPKAPKDLEEVAFWPVTRIAP